MTIRLKYEIKKTGMTQNEFAKLVGINPSLLSGFISEKRGISPLWRQKLSKALGWRGDPSLLFESCGFQEEREPSPEPEHPLPYPLRGTRLSVDMAKAVETMCAKCPIAFGDESGDKACESCMVRLISEVSVCGGMLGEKRLEHWRKLVREMAGRDAATF